MAKYEFTEKQVQNLKALIMDANIKGAAAPAIVELLMVLDEPVTDIQNDDLHGEHNDGKEHGPDGPQKNSH